MNALFLTQSGGLRLFYELAGALKSPLALEKIAFYVADQSYFEQFTRRVPEIESGTYYLLKEWDITRAARNATPNLDLIGQLERELGNPNLWGPLVADRRVYFGKKCTYFQDYRPRFNHEQMLSLLQQSLLTMQRLFDEVRPDFVVSFICVTYGEYVAYLFARSRGIPFLNLRPTRIQNYVTFGDTIFEPSRRIQANYERYLASDEEDGWTKRARDYVDVVRAGHAKYEGVLKKSPEPRDGPAPARRLSSISRNFLKLLRAEYDYRFRSEWDNHQPGHLIPFLYRKVLNPMRVRKVERRLAANMVTREHIDSLDYVLYPLHTEPEVTLLVYSRNNLNQIEVIRNLSYSLPVGMSLVVKEHPASWGKRPLSYYQKLLEIPNVVLAHPGLDSKQLVTHARMVATIAGSIGWEAVLRRKPVVVFGHTPYEFLPECMLRRVDSMERLGDELNDLMRSYHYREEAVIAYVASVMRHSAPVNFYSSLLGRPYAYSGDEEGVDSAQRRNEELETLARYTIDALRENRHFYASPALAQRNS